MSATGKATAASGPRRSSERPLYGTPKGQVRYKVAPPDVRCTAERITTARSAPGLSARGGHREHLTTRRCMAAFIASTGDYQSAALDRPEYGGRWAP